MRDPIGAILNALDRDTGGVVVLWCPDLGVREWLVGEVESVADAGAKPLRVETVEAALVVPERLALLVPRSEREAVLDLDGCRDRILEPQRTYPVVLFLLRNGDGHRALAESNISLASWVAGSDVDPDELAAVDAEAERQAFIDATAEFPEDFLAKWRRGELENTSANLGLAYRAMLLEGGQ